MEEEVGQRRSGRTSRVFEDKKELQSTPLSAKYRVSKYVSFLSSSCDILWRVGVAQSIGSNSQQDTCRRPISSPCVQKVCSSLLFSITSDFIDHFNVSRVFPEYYDTIALPMDVSTVRRYLADSGEHYTCVQQVTEDLRRIFSNCMSFNAEGSDIFLAAQNLADWLETALLVGLSSMLKCLFLL